MTYAKQLQKLKVQAGGCLTGMLQVPGDKSITHRGLILAALSKGIAKLSGWLASKDCLATLHALAKMGVQYQIDNNHLYIQGVGLYGLQQPNTVLDLGNSATGLRLLTGVLAAQKFNSTVTGDDSLINRPMARIIEPLQLMGARINSRNNCAPLNIIGDLKLTAITYKLPIASAQVKTALLLADLYAVGTTKVIEPIPCRDHTERMLPLARPLQLNIPGDVSAAAFFMVGATIAKGSAITLKAIGINPTRSGIIEILQKMGANITISNVITINNEPRADIIVRAAKLHGIAIPSVLVPSIIDEIPILLIAAAAAKGKTIITGARELRYKESDRIQAMAAGLRALGITVHTFADGIEVIGGTIIGGVTIDSYGDHRIAMAFAMAALIAKRDIVINNTANIATSFPNFSKVASEVCLTIKQV